MIKKFIFNKITGFLMIFLISSTVFSEENGSFSLTVTPSVALPLTGSLAELISLGGSVDIAGDIHLKGIPLFLRIGGGYGINSLTKETGSLSTITGSGGAGLNFALTEWLAINLHGTGGYSYAMKTTDIGTIGGGSGFGSGGAGITLHLGDVLRFGINADYFQHFGMFGGIKAGISGSLNFKGRSEKAQDSTRPDSGMIRPESLMSKGGLIIEDIELDRIFPVFYTYYEKNSMGKAFIKNTTESLISEINISLLVDQYMDAPMKSDVPTELKPGETTEIEFYALFTKEVFKITEGTKTSAEILIEYVVDQVSFKDTNIVVLEILHRNAMTWDDDRKAAAFVTAKDPTVLNFAKNVTGLVNKIGSRAINGNLQVAMGLHNALSLFGLSYVVDPTTPYIEYSENESIIDFLQFPKQTISYRAGDCDDLAILFNSLLEAVGIETAFITAPGHIYMAFSLDITPDEARSLFLRPDELIFMNDLAWLPVEITEIDGGFLKAWQTGAKEWRETKSRDLAGFFPVHEAWTIYSPSGFPGESTALILPDQDKISSAFSEELSRFIDSEIYPQVARIQANITATQGKSSSVNKLGLLYAKYGLFDRAISEFEKIISKTEYFPALLNIGNIHFLNGKMEPALTYYERAGEQKPDNAKVLLSLARVHHELENYGTVKRYFNKLEEISPEIAAQFLYLDFRGEEAVRAADLSNVKGVVIWEEEE